MKRNFTVRQGALDGVEAFLSVARNRSFRKAAADLGVTPSAISQAVRTLEARVGAALFIRTTRSVGLTEAGERFLSRAKPAFEELVAAGEIVRGLGQRPTGVLRLTVPRAVVPILLEPLIASFCQAFPEVEVEIAASEELIDLAAGGFDAGVRMGQFIAADMVAVRLAPPFPFVVGNKPIEAIVSGPLIAHDFPTLLGAAVQGMGLAQVPEPISAGLVKAGKLVRVLEPFAPMAPGVFLYYPSRHQMMPKLRAFVDHVKSRSATANKTQVRVDERRTRGAKIR